MKPHPQSRRRYWRDRHRICEANFPLKVQLLTAKTPEAMRMRIYDRHGVDLTRKFYVISYDMSSGLMRYMPKTIRKWRRADDPIRKRTVRGAQIKLMP